MIALKKPTGPRPLPRISVTKLGEYVGSRSAARRKTILVDQKYPKPFKTAIYNDCFDPLVGFFVDAAHNPAVVRAAITAIQSRTVATEAEEMRRQVNSQALDHLLNTVPSLPLTGITFRKAPESAKPLLIADVEVSIRPELELVVTVKGGYVRYGLLKLYLGKSHPLTDDAGNYVATLVHSYASHRFTGPKSVDRKHCYVFDVFQEKLFVAPVNHTQRRKDINAACEEIASRWPSL